jgi:hypothetical protein
MYIHTLARSAKAAEIKSSKVAPSKIHLIGHRRIITLMPMVRRTGSGGRSLTVCMSQSFKLKPERITCWPNLRLTNYRHLRAVKPDHR